MAWISYLFILRVMKLFKKVWHFSVAFCFLFNTSVSSVMGCYGYVAYKLFTSSLMCSINISIQSLPRCIFKGSGASPYKNVLCAHHTDGTCVFTFSVYGVLLFLSVFIFSLHCSFIGFSMLSKPAYSINGNLN